MKSVVFDTEVFPNYFLCSFMNVDTQRVRHFEMHADQALNVDVLEQILKSHRVIGFNSTHFDMPILAEAIASQSNVAVFKLCESIIKNNTRAWQHELTMPDAPDHVDLIEVAPGTATLKIYGGRLHCRRLQDLPIEPGTLITPDMRATLREYCANDLATTRELYLALLPQLQLRERMGEQYAQNLMSKSDAQIAEAVIVAEVATRMGKHIDKPESLAGTVFAYSAPNWISLASAAGAQALAAVAAAEFVVADNGTVKMPTEIATLAITIGAGVYRMGIGGLHSSESSVAHHADADHVLVDRDVASYYPSIILNCGLAPAQMGEHFSSVYRSIVERRLSAKQAGDKVTADVLKIVVNGSFGKLGSPYSRLYSPQLLIQTTLTGQLALLMLIERLEAEHISVVSANTDGIVIRCPRAQLDVMLSVIEGWEIHTGFSTEETEYRSLYSRDVNNYIAIKPDGKVKLKGVFAVGGLAKNPVSEICVGAVVKHLITGASLEDTVRACRDIRKFVTVRTVRGGALNQAGQLLGKAVRWYYSTQISDPLTYQINGYTVPRSHGAQACLELPDEIPDDLDIVRYVEEARRMLVDLGAVNETPELATAEMF